MKISINRANKIRNTLEQKTYIIPTMVVLRTDQQDTSVELFEGAQESATKEFEKSVFSLIHLKTVRDLIQKANEEYQITPLISEISHLERLSLHFKNVLATITSRSLMSTGKYDDYKATCEYRNTLLSVDVGKAPIGTGITVNITENLKKGIEEKLNMIKLKLSELQEQRNSKNHSNFVELPDELVEFLKGESLLAA